MDLRQARELFPVRERLAYFNHAAVSPTATPTRRAMEALLAESNETGALPWRRWEAEVERTRGTLATLVGAERSEIALLKNTSEGLATVAQGIDWRPGDRVVSFAGEFPANVYPWIALGRRGVKLVLLPEPALGDLERIRQACRGARLLTVSFVQYLSGFRADLTALGAICRETGTLLLVDAIQGLGAFPLDVKQCGIHFLAADGHKWLTGPEGAGMLFVDSSVLEQLVPPEVGWLSVEGWADYSASSKLQWRAGAARFECGTLNTCGLIGLGAAVSLLQEVGIEAIAEQVLGLGEGLRAGLRQRGCAILREGDPCDRRSGITSFQHPCKSAESLVAELLQHGIVCANRSGWVRCAPHFYNSSDEIERLLALL